MTQRPGARADAGGAPHGSAVDWAGLRGDFPILREEVHGRPLVYLDNAATTQKPRAVIEAVRRYYEHDNANIHRGVHELSARATQEHESARAKVQRFLNAASPQEIIFVRGATEAVNLVAQTHGRASVRAGDELLITAMEHHSNLVPWQMLCREKGATLRVIPITDAGEIRLDEYERMLTPRTKLVAFTHVSNVLGTVNPVQEMIATAHRCGVPVLVDGAQAAAHTPIDVRELGCDFYAISGHKAFGPTGIGVLYGQAELLRAMPPYQGGGDMIRSVTFEEATWNDLPYKFEAGTPDIAGAVGLGAAIDYVTGIGLDRIGEHESALLTYATECLSAIPGVRLIGTARHKAAVISFVLDGIHPHDVGTILDYEGVAVRAGHHCAQPLMQRLGLEATVRASLAFYNTTDEIDALAAGVRKAIEVFR